MPPKYLCGLDGQRAVEKHRHILGQLPLDVQQIKGIQHLLRSLNGKSGNDDLFTSGITVLNGLGHFIETVLFAFMIAITVSGFHKKVVRVADRNGILHEQLMTAADIAGENKFCGGAVFLNKQFQDGRPQNMAGVLKIDFDAGRRRKILIVGYFLDQRGHGFGVRRGIKRLAFLRPAVTLHSSRLRFCIGFLDMGAVQKQYLDQFPRRLRCVNRPFESVLHHAGQ